LMIEGNPKIGDKGFEKKNRARELEKEKIKNGSFPPENKNVGRRRTGSWFTKISPHNTESDRILNRIPHKKRKNGSSFRLVTDKTCVWSDETKRVKDTRLYGKNEKMGGKKLSISEQTEKRLADLKSSDQDNAEGKGLSKYLKQYRGGGSFWEIRGDLLSQAPRPSRVTTHIFGGIQDRVLQKKGEEG